MRLAVERPGRVGEFAGLVAHRLDDARMRVALAHGSEARQQVDVPFAIDVPAVDALAAAQDDRQGLEVVATVALVAVDYLAAAEGTTARYAAAAAAEAQQSSTKSLHCLC